MTMGPGASVYERFGHNAIWIRDHQSGRDLVYNYGTFSFEDPGYITRFVMGRPRYWLAEWGMENTIATYTRDQRKVTVQELALLPAQEVELAFRLAENLKPENRTYTYDYYLDNCSTRIRDLLDIVLGGRLSEATKGKPADGTLRFHTQRSLTNSAFMYLGIGAAMGPAVDQPLDQWGEMFLPEKVAARIAEIQVPDALGNRRSLVLSNATLLDFDVHNVAVTPPDWSPRLWLVGIGIAMLMATGLLSGIPGMFGRVISVTWLVISGIAGLLLLFLWFGTDHAATGNNRNVLLLTPLAFAVGWQFKRPRRRTNASGRLSGNLAIAAVIISVLAGWLLAGAQDNHEIASLVVLPTLSAAAIAWVISRRRAVTPWTPR